MLSLSEWPQARTLHHEGIQRASTHRQLVASQDLQPEYQTTTLFTLECLNLMSESRSWDIPPIQRLKIRQSGSTRTGKSREVIEGKAGMGNGLSGEAIRIMKKPGMPIRPIQSYSLRPQSRWALKKLYNEEGRSLVIVLVHSSFLEHEWLVGNSYMRSASLVSRNPHSYCR